MLKGRLFDEIHQSYFVVALAIGIIVGVILALVFRINYFASPVWVVFVILILIFSYLKPKMVFLGLALVAGMILAFFRASTELKYENVIRSYYGENVLVEGVVDGDAETEDGVTKLKLKELKINDGEENSGVSGVYVMLNQNENIQRSDKLVLNGKLTEGFGTYVGFMYRPKLVGIERPEPGDVTLKIRNWFAARIESVVPEAEAKLGLSYLLGMKNGLDDELAEQLRVVGLTHIVVASGAHLSILVGIARKLFGKLSRFAGVFFAFLFVMFFMTMVGFTPSIMRAGIMSIITLVLFYSGRKIEPWRIILLVMATTLMINPQYIINLGWLLSFASFIGIMVFQPEMVKLFYGSNKPPFVASLVMTTVAATLMTLPLTLYYYGTVSLISVVANLLILPTLSLAMGLVFVVGVVVGVPFVSDLVGFIATKVLDYHIAVVGWFGEMRQFLVEIPKYQWWVFLFYVVIIVFIVIVWWGSLKRRFSTFRLKSGKI